MYLIPSVVLLFLVICTFSSAQEKIDCLVISQDDVRSMFSQWNAALQSCDAERVVAMYWDQSILLPAFSNKIRPNAASKTDYFNEFLLKTPRASIIEDYIDLSGCNHAEYNGIYSFTLTDPVTGVAAEVPARFSFTFQTYDRKYWAIKTHHSSVMPNGPDGSSTRRNLRANTIDFAEDYINFSIISEESILK